MERRGIVAKRREKEKKTEQKKGDEINQNARDSDVCRQGNGPNSSCIQVAFVCGRG